MHWPQELLQSLPVVHMSQSSTGCKLSSDMEVESIAMWQGILVCSAGMDRPAKTDCKGEKPSTNISSIDSSLCTI